MALGGNMDCAYRSIRMIRDRDCDFLTVENVQAYSGYVVNYVEAARALLSVMGPEWCEASGAFEGVPVVEYDERLFSIGGGRRWTKVPEFLSNGQLTARWFVDEATNEVRLADGWKSPQATPIGGDAKAFVLAIVAKAREGVTA